MTEFPPVGSRVMLSALALNEGIRKQADPFGESVGTVLRITKHNTVAVNWDGVMTESTYSPKFLEVVT